MSVMVIIRFPVAFSAIADWAAANGEKLGPIEALFKKHGRISQRVVSGPDFFMDFDEWPSRETYAAFKAEAAPHIAAFEAAFGHASTDQVLDVVV